MHRSLNGQIYIFAFEESRIDTLILHLLFPNINFFSNFIMKFVPFFDYRIFISANMSREIIARSSPITKASSYLRILQLL